MASLTPMASRGGDPWARLRDGALARAGESLESGNPSEAIEWLKRARQTPQRRALEAQARYRLASELIVKRRFAEAEAQLGRIPQDSSINRFLIEERIRLVRTRRQATADLQAMARRFGDECDACRGRDFYAIATCAHRVSSVPPARKLDATRFAPLIEGAYAAASYRSRWDKEWADPMSQLLRLEKKALRRPDVRFMGYLLASYMCHHTPLVGAVDALVPIPTSGSREDSRGGCIPRELAEAIRDELAIPIREAIKAKGDYEDHQLVRGRAREQALRRSWVVRQDPVLQGRRVAVVDDVITTGTTMKTAASMLAEHGIGGVFALSLCHTESSRGVTRRSPNQVARAYSDR